MEKRKKRLIAFGGVLLAVLFIVVATYVWYKKASERKIGGYVHPKFLTEYTEEEHVARIEARTREKLYNAFRTREIVSCKVELVYAFYDNDPEYFLVTLEYAEEFSGSYKNSLYETDPTLEYQIEYKTKYKHILGFIENDEYKIGLTAYDNFLDGRSCYDVFGFTNAKKYYGGGRFAVKTDEGLLQIFHSNCSSPVGVEFHTCYLGNCFEQKIIPVNEYEYLMRANYKMFPKTY